MPPKQELCPPKRGLCPKESNRLGATGVQFEASDSQNTGCHSRIREQEPFILNFAIKTLFFRNSTLEIVEIRAFFEMKIFFFLVFIPDFVEICYGNFCLLIHTLEFGALDFLCPSKVCFCPKSPYPGRRAWTSSTLISVFQSFCQGLWLSEFGPTLPKKEGRPSLPRRQHWLQSWYFKCTVYDYQLVLRLILCSTF